MGVRDDIAKERKLIAEELLPAYVSELQALERRVIAGVAGMNAEWAAMKHGTHFALAGAFARLDVFEKALRVVELEELRERERDALHQASLKRFGSAYETYEPGWGECPDHKRAAANDR